MQRDFEHERTGNDPVREAEDIPSRLSLSGCKRLVDGVPTGVEFVRQSCSDVML